jgi:hypothetical protein
LGLLSPSYAVLYTILKVYQCSMSALICHQLVRRLICFSVHTALTYQQKFDFMQFFKDLNVTADQKKFFKKVLNSYYDAVSELLQSENAVTHPFCLLVSTTICLQLPSNILLHVPNHPLYLVSSSDGGRECKSFKCQRWTKWREHIFIWEAPEVFWSVTTWCILVSIYSRISFPIYLCILTHSSIICG